jgi:hypothetical protein
MTLMMICSRLPGTKLLGSPQRARHRSISLIPHLQKLARRPKTRKTNGASATLDQPNVPGQAQSGLVIGLVERLAAGKNGTRNWRRVCENGPGLAQPLDRKPPTQLEVFRIILFATAALTACIRIHHRDCHGASTSRHVPPVDVDREDVCLLVLAIDLLKLRLDAGDLAGAI